MNEVAQKPQSIAEIQTIVKDASCVLPVGRCSKPPLSRHPSAQLIGLADYAGITQYEPSEFTFTAKAGTTISEISAVLAEKGQYLPFDPLLSDHGATIGGTVAAGLSGPGRQRYGGIRDFLLGVQFVSSDGAVINAGGKVVKNAAGFDIPKLMVGSLGRLGIMTELTFKVFPRPSDSVTLAVTCQSHQQKLERIAQAASSRWETDAIDCDSSGLLIRLCGPAEASRALAAEITAKWTSDARVLDSSEADQLWNRLSELGPRHDDTCVAKVPTTPSQYLQLQQLADSREDLRLHLSVAGAVCWVWLESSEVLGALDQHLKSAECGGLLVIGKPGQNAWLGHHAGSEMEQRIQQAMDPENRFVQGMV